MAYYSARGHHHLYLWDFKKTDQLLAHVGQQGINRVNGLNVKDAVLIGRAISKTAE